MYPDLDVIGWYSATKDFQSDTPSKEDFEVTKSTISKFCDNPLMFLLNVTSKQAEVKKSLPLFCYELSKQEG